MPSIRAHTAHSHSHWSSCLHLARKVAGHSAAQLLRQFTIRIGRIGPIRPIRMVNCLVARPLIRDFHAPTRPRRLQYRVANHRVAVPILEGATQRADLGIVYHRVEEMM